MFTHPQALITGVSGFPGVDRYFFLPAPAGLAWDASLIRWGEGTGAAVVDHRHPFARYVDAIHDDLLYRAYFDERAPRLRGQRHHLRAFPGRRAAVASSFACSTAAWSSCPRRAGAAATPARAQASAILAATQELLRAPPRRPPELGRA